MKNFKCISLVVIALFFSACSDNSSYHSEEALAEPDLEQNLAFSSLVKNAAKKLKIGNEAKSKVSAPVFVDLAMSDIVDGATSTIHRNGSKVTVNFKADNIPHYDPSGDAITLWIAFLDDTFNVYSMYRLGGKVIGTNGKINISGSVKEGQTKDRFIFNDADPSAERPLEDASGPAVVVVKTHGAADPGNISAQIHTENGGCEGDPDGVGPIGPCYEFLFAFHFD